jgi:hypothetical protein
LHPGPLYTAYTIMDLRGLVANTRSQHTAIVRQYHRLGGPVGAEEDLLGVGVVDFDVDRLWISGRFLTDRVRAKRKAEGGRIEHIVNPPLYVFLDHLTGVRGLCYEGGVRWRRRRTGGWKRGRGSISDPKDSRHPLFILDPLARADTELAMGSNSEFVGGVATTRYCCHLGPGSFDPAAWVALSEVQAGPNAGDAASEGERRESVPVVLWLDEDNRILRVSYEAVHHSNGDGLWTICELSEFGVDIDSEGPPTRK